MEHYTGSVTGHGISGTLHCNSVTKHERSGRLHWNSVNGQERSGPLHPILKLKQDTNWYGGTGCDRNGPWNKLT